MKKSLAVTAILAIFLAGAAGGGLGAYLVLAQRASHHPAPLWFLDGPPLRHLERRLDLTEGQRREILEVIQDSRSQGDKLRRQIHPQLNDLRERTQVRIREILTPEQQIVFDDFHRRDRRFGDRHHPRRRKSRREESE